MSLCRKQEIADLKRQSDMDFFDLSQVGKLEPELLNAVLESIRKWEAKIGPIIASSHRDKTLRSAAYDNSMQNRMSPRFKAHPYINAHGADPNVSPSPIENVNSEEALRNELTNVPRPGPRPRFNPRPY